MMPANATVLGIVSVSALSVYQTRKTRKEKFLRFWSVPVLVCFIYLFGLEKSLETYAFLKKAKCKQTGFGNTCFPCEGQMRDFEEFPVSFHLYDTGRSSHLLSEGNGRVLIQSMRNAQRCV